MRDSGVGERGFFRVKASSFAEVTQDKEEGLREDGEG
jgi:hypothetical protein